MLDPRYVVDKLRQLAPDAQGYRVGLSGGRDSTALLHCLAQQRHCLTARLSAIHIDHRLHEESTAWARHCNQLCARLAIPLNVQTVSVEQNSPEGLEAAARRARYQAFSATLQAGECLILAHHADDQAETFLLRALRGGGVNALSAIPPRRPLARANLVRPLLGLNASDIDEYLLQHGLNWIDDPANNEIAYDRVYLRRTVLPRLNQRWPDAANRLGSSAAAIGHDRHLLNEYLDADLHYVRQPDGHPCVCRLTRLSEQRRRAVLRRWCELSGVRPPPRRQLIHGLAEMLAANPDACPEIRWNDALLRRYRNRLYLCPYYSPSCRSGQAHSRQRRASPEEPVQDCAAPPSPAPSPRIWQARTPLHLPGGTLEARISPDLGLDPSYCEQGLEVRWPTAAAQLPTAQTHARHNGASRAGDNRDRRRRKRLYQELGVPPWERGYRPLIYVNDRPVAVAGYGAKSSYSSRPGLRLLWL